MSRPEDDRRVEAEQLGVWVGAAEAKGEVAEQLLPGEDVEEEEADCHEDDRDVSW